MSHTVKNTKATTTELADKLLALWQHDFDAADEAGKEEMIKLATSRSGAYLPDADSTYTSLIEQGVLADGQISDWAWADTTAGPDEARFMAIEIDDGDLYVSYHTKVGEWDNILVGSAPQAI